MSISFEQIQPVVITAPTARNGVTLLQRLFNSSRQIIVYGENPLLTESLPLLVHQAYANHLSIWRQAEATRQRFLNETTEFWSSNLWPDTKAFADVILGSFRNAIMFCQRYSERCGFERWGIKCPFSNVNNFDRFLSLLPSGRFIYIYRNLFDVACSAKARKFVKNPDDFRSLAGTWAESLPVVLKAQAENLMVVRYEDLIEDPGTWISRMQTFTGITNIDPDVMNRKFNTFRGDNERGHSATEYIEPEPLTDDEITVLRETAGELLTTLNYTNRQPAQEVADAR